VKLGDILARMLEKQNANGGTSLNIA